MKLSEIFEEEPIQWGYRGDPILWRELKECFRDIDIPYTTSELQDLIEKKYEELTEYPISYQKDFLVDRYRSHGMSSGRICPEFWEKNAIPTLLERLAKS